MELPPSGVPGSWCEALTRGANRSIAAMLANVPPLAIVWRRVIRLFQADGDLRTNMLFSFRRVAEP
jgi:hypothetical protein